MFGFFKQLGNVLGIGEDDLFKKGQFPTNTDPSISIQPKETVGPPLENQESGPPKPSSNPWDSMVRKPTSYETSARELVDRTKPELSTGDKISRTLRTIAGGMKGNSDQVRSQFLAEDQQKLGREKAVLDIASQLETLDRNNISTQKLKAELETAQRYNQAANDPNSDVTKMSRSFAVDAVNAAPLNEETKKLVIDQINRSTAKQLTDNKLLDQLGVVQKINYDALIAGYKKNEDARAGAEAGRKAQLAPLQQDAERALAEQRRASADQSRAVTKQTEGLNKAETERDKAFAKRLDSNFIPAMQTLRADQSSFDRLQELVASKEFNPGDLTAIAEAYNSSRGDFGLFADGITKLNLSPGAQEFGAIISDLAPRQRPEGSGTTSDLDLRTFFKSLGQGLTDKNALLRRVTELQKRNSNKLKDAVGSYEYYQKNGTLKGYNALEEKSKEVPKYTIEEEKPVAAPPAKRKYTIEVEE